MSVGSVLGEGQGSASHGPGGGCSKDLPWSPCDRLWIRLGSPGPSTHGAGLGGHCSLASLGIGRFNTLTLSPSLALVAWVQLCQQHQQI